MIINKSLHSRCGWLRNGGLFRGRLRSISWGLFRITWHIPTLAALLFDLVLSSFGFFLCLSSLALKIKGELYCEKGERSTGTRKSTFSIISYRRSSWLSISKYW